MNMTNNTGEANKLQTCSVMVLDYVSTYTNIARDEVDMSWT